MKNLVNLKELDIYGRSHIVHAHLDSVPFSLTHLFSSWMEDSDSDTKIDSDSRKDPPLLAILQAHPTLEELGLSLPSALWMPRDLVSALKAEQEGVVEENDIICPKLRRFDGCDEGLRLFLPTRRIECVTALGRGAEYIVEMDKHLSIWLNPILQQSYQHIRVLEVWPEEDHYIWFFPTIALYLTSLTHLCIFGDVRELAHRSCDLSSALGQIETLQSITLSSAGEEGITMVDVQEAVQFVQGALPDVKEIFVGLEEEEEMVYYRYVEGEGMRCKVVGQDVACRLYTKWMRDS